MQTHGAVPAAKGQLPDASRRRGTNCYVELLLDGKKRRALRGAEEEEELGDIKREEGCLSLTGVALYRGTVAWTHEVPSGEGAVVQVKAEGGGGR